MVYTLDFGLFPFAGLITGSCLYAVYYWGLRLRCQARSSQTFIVVAMVLVTLSMFFGPSRIIQQNPQDLASTVSLDLPSDDMEPSFVAADSQPVHKGEATAVSTATTIKTTKELKAEAHNYNLLFSDVTHLLGWLYLAGMIIMLLYFAAQIAFLHLLRGQHEHVGKVGDGHVDIYQIPATHVPFSFGRSIFIPASLDDTTEHYVLMHEMAHVRHRHYLWLCLLEVLLVLNWFNPFMWLLFREMHLQQELEVDADMIDEGVDREEYQLSLVSMATHQGKWILTQSAFFGEPLKKRLLFMNTPIRWQNACIRLAVASLLACVVLTAVAGVSGQMRAHEQQPRHPFQGCWTLEDISSNLPGNHDYKPWLDQKWYKFVGDYGDLTFVCRDKKFLDIIFHIESMEQRVRGNKLEDVYGRPIAYKLKGDQLKWRNYQPGKEGYWSKKDQEETWRRTTPDPQIVELLRTFTYPEQAKSNSRELNGVWHLDSVVATDHLGKRSRVDVYVRNRSYLIINEPYYMGIHYIPTINEQTMCFMASGTCGVLRIDMGIQISPDSTSLTIDAHGIVSRYYHRVPMPPYLRRMFRPALIEE